MSFEIPVIDCNFIAKWEPQFDHVKHRCEEYSQPTKWKYQEILDAVQKDIADRATISMTTSKAIVDWKASRAKPNVNWGQFDTVYKPRFELIVSESISEYHKLPLLIWDENKLREKLPVTPSILGKIRGRATGFRVPMASTFLHFIFPDRFPIIDIRAAEVLYLVDKTKSTQTNYPAYDDFRSAILGIAKKEACSLREIDKALLAYHICRLQPAMGEKFKTSGLAVGCSEEEIGKGLLLNAPRKRRQGMIDIIKREAKNQKQ